MAGKQTSKGVYDMSISDERILELASQLLDMAGEEFGNHGCNDFRLSDWSPAERRQLAIDYEKYNGDTDQLKRLQGLPVGDREFEWFSDFCLMYYTAHRLKLMADGGTVSGRTG